MIDRGGILGGQLLHLSLHTDYSLRLLLALAVAEPGAWTATPAVAGRFGISAHHLQKIAQTLIRAGHVEARQGRSGGVRLARDPGSLRVGRLIAELEGTGAVVECWRGPCLLDGCCRFKAALDAAEQAFFCELDRFTLADLAVDPTAGALRALFRPASDGSPTLPPGN